LTIQLASIGQLLVEHIKNNYNPTPFLGKDGLYHFVYMTYNTQNFKFYIGKHSTSNLNDGYLGSGTYFKNALNSFGKEAFQRVYISFSQTEQECLDEESSIVSESFLQDYDFFCYNLSVGGMTTILKTKSMISKDGEERKIPYEDVDKYLQEGWELGAKRRPRLSRYDDTEWWGRNSYEEKVETLWINDSNLIKTKIPPQELEYFQKEGWVEGAEENQIFIPTEILEYNLSVRNNPTWFGIAIKLFEYFEKNNLSNTAFFDDELKEIMKKLEIPKYENHIRKALLEGSILTYCKSLFLGEEELRINPKNDKAEYCVRLKTPIYILLEKTPNIPPDKEKRFWTKLDNGGFSGLGPYEDPVMELYEDYVIKEEGLKEASEELSLKRSERITLFQLKNERAKHKKKKTSHPKRKK
jgi:hypothetical protein